MYYYYHPVIHFTNDVTSFKSISSPFNVLSSVRLEIIDDHMSMREELGKIGIESAKFAISSESIYDIIREYKDLARCIVLKSFKNNQFVHGEYNTIVKLPDTIQVPVSSGNNKFAGLLSNMTEKIGVGIMLSYPTYKKLKPTIITNCTLYIDLIDVLNLLLEFDTQNVGLLLLDLNPNIRLDGVYQKYRIRNYESYCAYNQTDDSTHKYESMHMNENPRNASAVCIYSCKLADAINTHIGDNNRSYLKSTNNQSLIHDQIPIYITTSGRFTESDRVLADIVIDDHSSNVISDILVSASTDELIMNICKNAIGSILDLELICSYKIPAK